MNTPKIFRTVMTASALVILLGSPASAQGSLEIVGGNTYDWGVVPPTNLSADIQVKNVGDDTLTIISVSPSCGCFVAPIDRSVLAPQEIATINVKIRSISRGGPTTRSITITSSDPKNPTQVIHLKADVDRSILFNPPEYLLVSNGIVGRESDVRLRIVNTGDSTFTVYPPDFVPGNIRVRFELVEAREVKPGDQMELKAYITPLESGTASGAIRVRTSLAGHEQKEIPVFGNFYEPPPPALVEPASAAAPKDDKPKGRKPKGSKPKGRRAKKSLK